MNNDLVGINKGDNDIDNVDYNEAFYKRMKFYNSKKKFSFIFPLKYLFGFTEYNKIIYRL